MINNETSNQVKNSPQAPPPAQMYQTGVLQETLPTDQRYPQLQQTNPQGQQMNAPQMIAPPQMQGHQQAINYLPPTIQNQEGHQQPNQNASKSPFPVLIKCPHCNQSSVTTVTSKAGSGTYTWCAILCIFTGCCCIPFCIDSCQDKVHKCSKCQNVVGIHEYKAF